ncbi:hypothetical protein CEXT_661481 [Caerostris extrusa]|uniref:Transposase n=1 Tax=Caerostris extrusa TaxID=172846 RepID=A0AAV4PRG4_CAEEX|nr:hypothetical protein CEXT_661481 [Caerostris extrusa]
MLIHANHGMDNLKRNYPEGRTKVANPYLQEEKMSDHFHQRIRISKTSGFPLKIKYNPFNCTLHAGLITEAV